MALSNYFDYIHTLLSDDEWEQYKICAVTGVMRSLTGSRHRPWGQVREHLTEQGRSFTKPGFGVADNHRLVDREDKSIPLGHHWGHLGGWYYIQESAASLPATLIDYQPDDVILDMCAAPGGKTSQIASNLLRLGGSGFVVANEIDNVRRSTLKENIARMGLYNVTVTYRHSSWRAEQYSNTFDHIVVDAPCSGEGTIFRTTEFMDDWGIGLTHRNAEIQKQILADALICLKPGGTLIYSTCTLNTNENEGVVAWILEQFGDQVQLVPTNIEGASPGLSGYGLSDDDCSKVARFWPHIQKTGGFWVSKFYKRGEKKIDQNQQEGDHILYRNKSSKIQDVSTSHSESRALLKSQRDIVLPKHTRIYEDKGCVYLTTISKLVGYESGLPILKLGYESIIPLAPLIPALGHLSAIPKIALTAEQVQQWLQNTQIEFNADNKAKGWVIVTCNGFYVGLGKLGGGVLKNKIS